MAEEEEPPQGVIVCVRVRPMFLKRPDGTPAREAKCKRVVEMDGKNPSGVGSAMTKIYNPEDMEAKPREFCFDRSYWSCDGFKEDPDRPGFNIPDGPTSKYVSQDMVWNDVGQMVMRKALTGYNCTVFAYGQSGAGKSYSVVGYPPNSGIIPNALQFLFDKAENNTDPNVKYTIEIAMLEVYLDEVYDLLEPRVADRKKLKVWLNGNQVVVYDPNDRKNMDKIWRAARDADQAEQFRLMGDANRSVRPTGMNPSSSRGHTIFMCRFNKFTAANGDWVEEFRSKISLVDLAGSERAGDTGLTGIGLKEGIAINQSLTYLGQVLVSLCKGERVNYRDKLTQLLAESLNGTAVTVMVAALSPADINYEDTLSTLRFADNAKKMPVKVAKQMSPTAQLIADLKAENAKLVAELSKLKTPEGMAEAMKSADEHKAKLQEAEGKLSSLMGDYEKLQEQLIQLKEHKSSTGEAVTPQQEEKALEELETKMASKMEEIQKVTDVKNNEAQIVEDEQGGLIEKQLAVAALLEQAVEDQSLDLEKWEEKLDEADQEAEKLKDSFHDKGLSVTEMLGLMNAGMAEAENRPPYFVNLAEDAHDHGMVYFIPSGSSRIKKFDELDKENCIKLPGDTIEDHHATLDRNMETGKVTISAASETAGIWVNGNKLKFGEDPTPLTHSSRVILGFEFIFRFVDPTAKVEKKFKIDENGRPMVIDFQYAIEELEEKSGTEVLHAVENVRKTQASRKTALRKSRAPGAAVASSSSKTTKTVEEALKEQELEFKKREEELRKNYEQMLKDEREKMRNQAELQRSVQACTNAVDRCNIS